MISKVTTSVPFVFTPKVQAQILCNVINNAQIHVKSYEYEIEITSGNVVLKYDSNEYDVKCSQEWILVMNALNNMSCDTKKLILSVLEKFPKKLLLMIDIILLMGHHDIVSVILSMIFDGIQHGRTYNICTYVNRNDVIESIVCYSVTCGFEINMYGVSRHVINYFGEILNINDYSTRFTKMKEMCINEMIDVEQKLCLMRTSRSSEMIIVGKVEDFKCLLFVYMANCNLITLDQKQEIITSQMVKSCKTDLESHDMIKRELCDIDYDIRVHHNIVDGKLC